jgi:hypothetical protein
VTGISAWPLSLLAALCLVVRLDAQQAPPPVHVVLWFDAEDYILPEDDDATKRLAEMLTRLNVKATFKFVGEKARVLEQRGRSDVIAALKPHDIGYHSNTHSQQPTIAVYLQHAGWDDGRAEFERREAQGARDVARIFGRTPVAYGQPGSAWAPQSYPTLRAMGIGMYLDESDHVGIDDQPFYYGGMLNVFKMRSTLARVALDGTDLAASQARFTAVANALRGKGGGTISIYYHPSEWVHAEFWDAVNFSRGANPPRAAWKQPKTRPLGETEKAFADFEQYIRFIQQQPGVRFVTATDLMRLYADRAATRSFTRDDLRAIAAATEPEIAFQRRDGDTLSAADVFGLLTNEMATFVRTSKVPEAMRLTPLPVGPTRPFAPSAGATRSSVFPWEAFSRAITDASDFCRARRRVPDEIWVGAENLSPADFLATLAPVVERVLATGQPPSEVARREGRFTADRYVAQDSIDLWGWPIFPEGFHAPAIMALARLQAWTLKPAMLTVPGRALHGRPN